MLGLAAERDDDYAAAAGHFRKAWELSGKTNAPAGFKLAFCLLRARRHTESVEVCEAVLALYPEYPRIREEILRKALAGLYE